MVRALTPDQEMEAGSGGAAGAPAPRNWSHISNRILAVMVPWLVGVVALYFVALNAPGPGLPGPIQWALSPIETNPFRDCHIDQTDAPPTPAAADQPVQKSSLFIRESYAQESAPVQEFAPTKGGVPNAAAQQAPVEQAQEPANQQTEPLIPPGLQTPARQPVLAGAVIGCSEQGFGDLVDVVMDQKGVNAWAINGFGQVYRTDDGGANWSRQDLPDFANGDRTTAIGATDDGMLLIIAARHSQDESETYQFYRSDDGGDGWRREPSLEFPIDMSIGAPPTIIGLGLGDGGRYVLALTTADPLLWRDDRPTWQSGFDIELDMIHGLRTHNFGDRDTVVNASGSTGLPVLSWERGYMDSSLRLQRLGTDSKGMAAEESLTSFQVDMDLIRALAASEQGDDIFIAEPESILHGNSRGEPWSRIDLAPLAPGRDFTLTSIDVARETKAIMAVGNGALFISQDGGATFFEPPMGRAPAPWFYAVLLAGPGLAAYSLWPRKKAPTTLIGDRSNALADRPLGIKDADAFNLGAYARGLLALLRNPGTEAPLVIGVTGAWGSGKSSIMFMLSELLAQNRMPTVWFNAWHHQSEEHLLASLLSNIRRQGIPYIWSRAGLRLRVRLLAKRLFQLEPLGEFLWSWFLLLLVVLLIPGSLILWIATALGMAPAIPIGSPALIEKLANVLQLVTTCASDNCKTEAAGLATLQATAIPAFLISSLPLAQLWKVALATRRFDPGKLMASMMPSSRNPNLDDQLSFRHRFGDELRATVAALSPLRLVIFIDDLDRCRPENVVAVLEAVNFVVSSADCCVVMGLDRPYVLRAIRQEFKDFIEMERQERATGGVNPEEDKGRPADFAEHYLEKLINLFVAVPKMTDQAMRSLMEQLASGRQVLPVVEGWRTRIARGLPRAAAILVVLAALFTPAIYSALHRPESSETPAASAQYAPPAPVGQPVAARPEAAKTGETITPDIMPSDAARNPSVPSVDNAGLVSIVIVALMVAVVTAVALILAIRVPPDLFVPDTTAFRDELKKAEDRLTNHLTTPRRTKRFVNRVRMFASVFKATKSEKDLKSLDPAELDRVTVAAGALHTLGRELLQANRSPGEEPDVSDETAHHAWENARKAVELRQAAIREPMVTFYQETRVDIGEVKIALVDELYWKFWEVVDGVEFGDEIVGGMMRDATILSPRMFELDAGPAVGSRGLLSDEMRTAAAQ